MNHPDRGAWRSIGFWLALALALSQLSNAVRVALGVQEYSAYMGLPLVSGEDSSWVYVYALRALFMGVFAGYLLIKRHYQVMSAMALFAIVMPAGDFYLVWQADGSAGTLFRHALIAAVLVAAWISLDQLARRQNSVKPA